ncbi:MAG: DUF3488 domain-containing protein [Pirellulales bacterium]|nr:DUF3488 domain-containing protein [Pirellulales bacterium]
MNLERLLQISVATLASLATLLLSVGQRSVAMPLMVIAAAFLSVWLVDFTGWFRLKRIPAGIAAILAMLFCLGELIPLNPATAIITIARLLVYLQVILLFQKKEPRVYWQLIVLSLLQVVVATVFNQGFWFGLMMVVYLFTALMAMTLLCLLREELSYKQKGAEETGEKSMAKEEPRGWKALFSRAISANEERSSAILFPGRELFVRVAMLGVGTLILTAAAFFTLPRLGQPAWRGQNVAPRRSVGYSYEVTLGELGLIIENPEEVMRIKFSDPDNGRKVSVDGEIYLQGAVLTTYQNGKWKRSSLGGESHTYEPTGGPPYWRMWPWRSRGPGLKDRSPSDDEERPRQPGEGRPPWHGSEHHRWSGEGRPPSPGEGRPPSPGEGRPPSPGEGPSRWLGDGRFRRPPFSQRRRYFENIKRETALKPLENPPKNGVVRQTIIIEPMDRCELFCIRPFFVTQSNPSISLAENGERLLRSPAHMNDRFTFHLNTTAIASGRQTQFVQAEKAPDIQELLQLPEPDSSDNSAEETSDGKSLPNLQALADRWMTGAPSQSDDWAGQARYLKFRLEQDKRFSYSLEGQPRDWHIDPIEDFVANNPKGHCEYFATALTLMLRSQGIPARMVIGFKCDEFNQVGDFYQVRQLHAHTWVEVYLPPDKLPPALKKNASQAGVWMRLDPTPMAADIQNEPNALIAPLAGALDWVEFAWDNYVMEMDRTRQQEAIYGPFVKWIKTTVELLMDPNWWRLQSRKLFDALNPRNWNTAEWFSWRGGLVGMAICLGLVFLYRSCRFAFRLLRKRLDVGRRRRRREARAEVQFYRRLGSILAKHGLSREESQTPREFARSAGETLAKNSENTDLATLPEMVVEAFYMVRFGHVSLDKNRRDAIEHALARLESL